MGSHRFSEDLVCPLGSVPLIGHFWTCCLGSLWFRPGFPWFLSCPWFSYFPLIQHSTPCLSLSELSLSFSPLWLPRFSWKATHMQTIGLANHRFRNSQSKGFPTHWDHPIVASNEIPKQTSRQPAQIPKDAFGPCHLWYASPPPFSDALSDMRPSKFRHVPPYAVKTCSVRPFFARVVGELRAADPSKCPKAHEAKC